MAATFNKTNPCCKLRKDQTMAVWYIDYLQQTDIHRRTRGHTHGQRCTRTHIHPHTLNVPPPPRTHFRTPSPRPDPPPLQDNNYDICFTQCNYICVSAISLRTDRRDPCHQSLSQGMATASTENTSCYPPVKKAWQLSNCSLVQLHKIHFLPLGVFADFEMKPMRGKRKKEGELASAECRERKLQLRTSEMKCQWNYYFGPLMQMIFFVLCFVAVICQKQQERMEMFLEVMDIDVSSLALPHPPSSAFFFFYVFRLSFLSVCVRFVSYCRFLTNLNCFWKCLFNELL